MIRTLTLLTAIAAIAGPAAASAEDVRVSLVGKDMKTIRAEIRDAAETVCSLALTGEKPSSAYRVSVHYEMMSCVDETVTVTLKKLDNLPIAVASAPPVETPTTVADNNN